MLASVFLSYIPEHQLLTYAAIFLAIIIEGHATLFIVAFLVHEQFLEIDSALLVVTAAVLFGDIIYFLMGRKAIRLPSLVEHWIANISVSFDDRLTQRTFDTLFFSKFTYGFHNMFLIRAGMLGLKFRNFIKADLLASFFWVVIIGGLGYFAGTAYSFVKDWVRFVEIGLGGTLLIFILVDKFVISRSIKRKL